MKHIGLFEGIGGFSLAARWMGWDTIAWCEWNEFCQKVLSYHFPKAKKHDDITKTDFTIYRGKCDILTGGFPCQPYSQAGKRKGKEDNRHLWPEMLRAIKEIQPSWVVGENVLGLVNWSRGMVFHEVQTDLEAAGYEVFPYVLPACAVNAPHRRDRVWFVAYNNSFGQSNGYAEFISNEQGFNNGGYTESDVTDTQSRRLEGFGGFGEIEKVKRDIGAICFNERDSINTASNSNNGGRSKDKRQTRRQKFKMQNWAEFPTKSPICSRDDGLPIGLAGITIPKHRNESIKAYGNAIVPQVAYEIFKAIQKLG